MKRDELKRTLIIRIAELCANAVDDGLPQEQIVEAIESALRCEQGILKSGREFAKFY